jgi:hypothetical protein
MPALSLSGKMEMIPEGKPRARGRYRQGAGVAGAREIFLRFGFTIGGRCEPRKTQRSRLHKNVVGLCLRIVKLLPALALIPLAGDIKPRHTLTLHFSLLASNYVASAPFHRLADCNGSIARRRGGRMG